MSGFFTMFFSLGTALFFLAFYVLALAFMFWMAVDAAKHDRFWWLVIIIALPLAGAVAYYAVERKHLYKKVEKGPAPLPPHHEHRRASDTVIVDEVNGKIA